MLAFGGGLFLFVQITLFNIAILKSNSSHSILLISTFVFWVALIEHFVMKTDRLTGRTIGGMVLCGIGVALTLVSVTNRGDHSGGQADQPSLSGDLLMIVSAVVLSAKVVYTKRMVKDIPPTAFIFWHHVSGAILFIAASFIFERSLIVPISQITWPAIWGLLYQGIVVGGFCFALQARLLSQYSATQISVFAFSTPLFGLVAAVLIRGDQISPSFAISVIFVGLGIFLVTTSGRNRAKRDNEVQRPLDRTPR